MVGVHLHNVSNLKSSDQGLFHLNYLRLLNSTIYLGKRYNPVVGSEGINITSLLTRVPSITKPSNTLKCPLHFKEVTYHLVPV